LDVSPGVFAVVRVSPEGDRNVLTLTSVTTKETQIEIPLGELGTQEVTWRDLISGEEWQVQRDQLSIHLEPYEVIWLTPKSQVQTTGG